MNKRIKKKKEKLHNKYLCERYPFLIPRNRWTDEICKDYNWTELDAMDPGWRKAFGKEMMEELREDLIKCNYLDKFRILQIKEKYGGLRFYTGRVPVESNAYEIIKKYEDMSYGICTECGRPGHQIDDGWIWTMCDSCYKQMKNRQEQRYKKINYLKKADV